MIVYHLIAPGAWPADGDYRPESLEREGFVHFSFAQQVAGSADRHYADAAALVAVAVDAAALARAGLDVVVEDSYGSGTAFPHVYGPIPAAAAVAVHPLHRGADGRWVFTGSGAAAPASPDR